MWTYRLRYVRCGKSNCFCADGSVGHGPYWYGYEHRGGRMYSKYFGKRPTSSFTPPTTPTTGPPKDNRWTFKGRMDLRTALRIFALQQKPNRETLVARYRVLANEHHPDHGGSNEIMAAINAAYAYLR